MHKEDSISADSVCMIRSLLIKRRVNKTALPRFYFEVYVAFRDKSAIIAYETRRLRLMSELIKINAAVSLRRVRKNKVRPYRIVFYLYLFDSL